MYFIYIMSKRSSRSKKFGKPGIGNLYYGYRKETKQKLFKKCKCGDENEDYLLIIDPESNEIEGGIKLNIKKSSPTKKSKHSLKKGGRKKTLKQTNKVKKNKNKTRNKNKTKKYKKKRKARTNKKRRRK